MAAPHHKSIGEMTDIVCNDMKELYDRGDAEEEIREVLQLERAIDMECERRETDARKIIRGESCFVYTLRNG